MSESETEADAEGEETEEVRDATGEQTLRLIHDPSGSVIYETTVAVGE